MNKREVYRELVRGAHVLIKEEARKKSSLLVSKESAAYFQPKAPQKKVLENRAPAHFSAPQVAPPVRPTPKPVEKKVEHAPQVPEKAPPAPPAASKTPNPPVKQAPLPMDEWRRAFARTFPTVATVDRPPDDARAIEIASRWKRHLLSASVLILYFGEKGEDLEYLKNLAKAIHNQVKPTKILDALSLEKEKKWELTFQLNKLELIIADEKSLFNMPELKRFYLAPTSVSSPLIANTPLILLNPEIKQDKAALWKKICLIAKN